MSFYTGLAALAGQVYIVDGFSSDLLEFDPLTNTITNTLDIDVLNPGFQIFGEVAGIFRSDRLVATAFAFGIGYSIVEIDPASGLITSSFVPAGRLLPCALPPGDRVRRARRQGETMRNDFTRLIAHSRTEDDFAPART